MRARLAKKSRATRETALELRLKLDGTGRTRLKIGIPFMEHLLDVMCRQALFDLEIKGKGDLNVDYHHMIEDLGLLLGDALGQALADKAGIRRYGWAEAPLDEAAAKAVLDLSGRPYLVYSIELKNRRIRDFDTQLIEEFLRAFCDRARMTLHLHATGKNNHHVLEAAFKALGLALRQACERDPRRGGAVASTKGTLSK
jgi:imidazoleglycerol-phosphate dehydratase